MISLKMQRKKRKTWNSKDEARMEHLIGKLPNEVVTSIFSHLALKEAARTSVLSRVWKNLWTLTPHFNFNASKRIVQILDKERNKYVEWVNQVVENHQGSYLDELVVAFDLDEKHYFHLDKWIRYAVTKGVKAIEIDLSTRLSACRIYSFVKGILELLNLPKLTRLKQLRVKINPFHTLYICGFAEFINSCPFFHKFIFELFADTIYQKIQIKRGKLRPNQNLKVVKIIGFVGRNREIEVAKFFLENPSNLEKLIINSYCECLVITDDNNKPVRLLRNVVAPGSREKAQELRKEIPSIVELLIL